MAQENVESFGKWIIGHVRENACTLLRQYAKGDPSDRIGRVFRDLYSNHPGCQESDIGTTAVIAVDVLLDSLLSALDQDPNLVIKFGSKKTGVIDLKEASDGLAGELYGKSGWYAKYARTPSQLM